MEGSNHCLSYEADETNENKQNNHQVDFNLKKQKKKTTKNFISPTISAASKAKKKILSERNESSEFIFSDTHVPKPPNFDSKLSSPNLGTGIKDSTSPITASFSRVYQFDDEKQKTYVSLQAYDPLSNYLTPRPKFLRYNPNRRREIFLRHENESNETEDGSKSDKSGSFDSKNFVVEEAAPSAAGSLASSSPEDSVKQEDEEIEESDQEFEGGEEERDWNLKGVLNTLLVFVVLVLSTLYISSMNSPTPPPALQAILES